MCVIRSTGDENSYKVTKVTSLQIDEPNQAFGLFSFVTLVTL